MHIYFRMFNELLLYVMNLLFFFYFDWKVICFLSKWIYFFYWTLDVFFHLLSVSLKSLGHVSQTYYLDLLRDVAENNILALFSHLRLKPESCNCFNRGMFSVVNYLYEFFKFIKPHVPPCENNRDKLKRRDFVLHRKAWRTWSNHWDCALITHRGRFLIEIDGNVPHGTFVCEFIDSVRLLLTGSLQSEFIPLCMNSGILVTRVVKIRVSKIKLALSFLIVAMRNMTYWWKLHKESFINMT